MEFVEEEEEHGGQDASRNDHVSDQAKDRGKVAKKKLTPAQKKKAMKVQAQREVLKATGQFNPPAK